MYEKHWGFNYNDDDYLMHYGIKGMKWKNHVYKKYNKLKKRFKHIFGSKSSKKKKVAKEKVSPEIKQLRSELDAMLGSPIKKKTLKDYPKLHEYAIKGRVYEGASGHGDTFKEYVSKNLPVILSDKNFLKYRQEIQKYIAQAYPNDSKKRRQLNINLNNYIENQARDALAENYLKTLKRVDKSTSTYDYDITFGYEKEREKYYGDD